eukprot:1792818-Pyramimonas_sp.AAC.1
MHERARDIARSKDPASYTSEVVNFVHRTLQSIRQSRWHFHANSSSLCTPDGAHVFFGNPRRHSTWHDEAFNKVIRSVADRSHRRAWEERIFQRLRLHGNIVHNS